MKRCRLRVILDADDVLMPCAQLAVEMANKEYNYKNPISIEEISGWGKTGKRTDILLKYYNDPEFFKKQTLYPGAKEFVHKLSRLTEVFIVTAVCPEIMTTRATMLREFFPEIPTDHIILGSRKDVVDADVHLDDSPSQILDSNAAYPVLMRKPWNYYLTGLLAVNTYDEFLWLINEILNNFTREESEKEAHARIVALVGPSGSGKNDIADELQKEGIIRLKSYTTKKIKNANEKKRYNFVTEEEFLKMRNKGLFFETSIYAGAHYGTILSDIEKLLKENKNIVVPIDIAGAIALKSKYGDLCTTVYVKKDKKEIINNILKEPYDNEEKANRLISLNAEYKNKNICNIVVCNTSIEEAVRTTKKLFKKI